MEMESGGTAGKRGSTHDFGLMQTKASVVEMYNRNHKRKIHFSRMVDTTPDAAADQIRVGAWLIAHQLKQVHKTDPARAPWPKGPISDWQVHLADLRYSRGGGAAPKLRARAIAAGYPDTLEGWYDYRNEREPGWGEPGRPFWHAAKVAAMYRANGGTRSGDPFLPRFKPPGRGKRKNDEKRPVKQADPTGILLVATIALIAAAY